VASILVANNRAENVMFEQDILVEWGKNAGIHSSISLTKPICKY